MEVPNQNPVDPKAVVNAVKDVFSHEGYQGGLKTINMVLERLQKDLHITAEQYARAAAHTVEWVTHSANHGGLGSKVHPDLGIGFNFESVAHATAHLLEGHNTPQQATMAAKQRESRNDFSPNFSQQVVALAAKDYENIASPQSQNPVMKIKQPFEREAVLSSTIGIFLEQGYTGPVNTINAVLNNLEANGKITPEQFHMASAGAPAWVQNYQTHGQGLYNKIIPKDVNIYVGAVAVAVTGLLEGHATYKEMAKWNSSDAHRVLNEAVDAAQATRGLQGAQSPFPTAQRDATYTAAPPMPKP